MDKKVSLKLLSKAVGSVLGFSHGAAPTHFGDVSDLMHWAVSTERLALPFDPHEDLVLVDTHVAVVRELLSPKPKTTIRTYLDQSPHSVLVVVDSVFPMKEGIFFVLYREGESVDTISNNGIFIANVISGGGVIVASNLTNFVINA
jgi:hypothetical protein